VLAPAVAFLGILGKECNAYVYNSTIDNRQGIESVSMPNSQYTNKENEINIFTYIYISDFFIYLYILH
jgi:hypothetical protein